MARRRTSVIAAAPGGSYVEWGAIIAGAIGASAISFLLLTFGAAIGLTLTSPWPNAGGLGAWGMMIAVAWWAVMVQIGSFFAGGYLAGRMRRRFFDADEGESDFRDSTHGFLVWAVGVLMIVLMAAGVGGTAVQTASQSVSAFAGAATAKSDKSGVSTADYAADLVLRRTGTGPAQNTPSDPAQREEVKRVFTTTIANGELSGRDRDYLAQMIASRNGVSPDEGRNRVDQAIQEVQKYEVKAREAADKARKAGILSGFLAGASLLISLAAAVFGAGLGGNHRDDNTVATFFGTRFW